MALWWGFLSWLSQTVFIRLNEATCSSTCYRSKINITRWLAYTCGSWLQKTLIMVYRCLLVDLRGSFFQWLDLSKLLRCFLLWHRLYFHLLFLLVIICLRWFMVWFVSIINESWFAPFDLRGLDLYSLSTTGKSGSYFSIGCLFSSCGLLRLFLGELLCLSDNILVVWSGVMLTLFLTLWFLITFVCLLSVSLLLLLFMND